MADTRVEAGTSEDAAQAATVAAPSAESAPSALTEATRLRAREIIARYPRPRSALLPMLHLVQSEEGYVSPAGIGFCAEELGLTKAEVGAVATFYTMFKRQPTGEYLVSVCTNTLCGLLGGDEIYAALSEYLEVGHNQTAPAAHPAGPAITLEHAECLAACDYAPVVTVNYEFFDNQSEESALGLVKDLQAGGRPMPTRGAPLCTFREISRLLAGFPEDGPETIDAGPAGPPTLIGARMALERGDTAPAYPDAIRGGGAEPTRASEPVAGGTPATGTPAAGTPAGGIPAGRTPAATSTAENTPEKKPTARRPRRSPSSGQEA